MSKFTPVRQVKNMRHVYGLFQNRRTLWQMLKEVFKGQYRMSLLSNLALVLGVLYVLFPFDIITDLIPFFGWMDDGFVIFMVIKRLQKETQRYNRFKVMERRGF
jgi:uncharacterized membrane protein YkvA (DUF1232 family)